MLIYDSYKKGDMKEALRNQNMMNRNIDELVKGNIARWKSALTMLDIDPGYTVAPACMPSDEDVKELVSKLVLEP